MNKITNAETPQICKYFRDIVIIKKVTEKI